MVCPTTGSDTSFFMMAMTACMHIDIKKKTAEAGKLRLSFKIP